MIWVSVLEDQRKLSGSIQGMKVYKETRRDGSQLEAAGESIHQEFLHGPTHKRQVFVVGNIPMADTTCKVVQISRKQCQIDSWLLGLLGLLVSVGQSFRLALPSLATGLVGFAVCNPKRPSRRRQRRLSRPEDLLGNVSHARLRRRGVCVLAGQFGATRLRSHSRENMRHFGGSKTDL